MEGNGWSVNCQNVTTMLILRSITTLRSGELEGNTEMEESNEAGKLKVKRRRVEKVMKWRRGGKRAD